MALRVTRGAIVRYRTLAYITGVALVVLVFVGIPMQVVSGNDTVVAIVGVIHGYLFPVYVLFTLDLSRRARWKIGRTIVISLAGTIPFASFFAERNVVHGLQRQGAVTVPAAPSPPAA
jgi:integral membrane protein